MKRLAVVTIFALLAWPAAAQRNKLDINLETPEGQLLGQIGTEEDAQKKIAMLEDFTGKFPQNSNIIWAYGQLQGLYLKSSQFDKVLPAVEKLLQADPTDSEMAHAALKAAEAKKDPDLILKWAEATSEAARKAVQTKQPADEDEVELWKHKIDFAKQVETYAEYSLFNGALQATDPAKKILLIDKLTERNAKSQYAGQLDDMRFLAYRQLNNNEKALEVAERMLAGNAGNEDAVLFAADQAFQKKENAKALGYATKAVELMKSKPAPQGVAAADWDKKKNSVIGVGLWLAGMIHSGDARYGPADVALREALPYLEGNDQLKAGALFNLGLANYKLGEGKTPDTQRILDAIRFNQLCSAIKSPYQGQAAKNVAAIRSQYRIK